MIQLGYSWFGNCFEIKTIVPILICRIMLVFEGTDLSFMPVIKAAVGGRVWERSREDGGELDQDCHLVVRPALCKVKHVLRFMCFFSNYNMQWVGSCSDSVHSGEELNLSQIFQSTLLNPELALHQQMNATTSRIYGIYHLSCNELQK